MKTVYQDPEEPECGAACVAMLASIPISEAKEALYGKGSNARRVGRKRIIEALRSFGIKTVSTNATVISSKNRLRDVKGKALVYGESLNTTSIPLSSSKHWLVWDGKEQALRDPMGFNQPIRITLYTEIISENW